MPILRNQRHERFAQNIATCIQTKWSNGRCYSEAGFKTDNRSADACAARLLTNANVSARIEELLAPTVQKTRTTIDTLAEQLDAVFAGASGDRQWGAAGSAAALKAKLLGFMREKIEIGSAGQFDGCQTTDEVIEALLAHHESPAAALAELAELGKMIEAYASTHARPVLAAETARPQVPGRETELALAELRPQYRRR